MTIGGSRNFIARTVEYIITTTRYVIFLMSTAAG
jgi:hypothetical protein